MIILIIHTIVSYDQNISLIFMWKMDPMLGCDIRLMFTLPPRDSTLQYKRCVHLWNNFPCIITLVWAGNSCFTRWKFVNVQLWFSVKGIEGHCKAITLCWTLLKLTAIFFHVFPAEIINDLVIREPLIVNIFREFKINSR